MGKQKDPAVDVVNILLGKRSRGEAPKKTKTDEPVNKKPKISAENENEKIEKPEKAEEKYYATFSGAGTDVLQPKAPNKPGERDNNGGTLHFYFLAMGQGDCTVLVTPTNDLFIIDIGTDGSEHGSKQIIDEKKRVSTIDVKASSGILRNLLRQPNIAGSSKRLKGLILTHSDADHSNRINILENLSISVEQVFHSNIIKKYAVKNILNTLTPEKSEEEKSNDISILGVSYTTKEDNPTQLTFEQAQEKYGSNPNAETIIQVIKEAESGHYSYTQDVSPVKQYHSFRNGKNKAVYTIPKNGPTTMVVGDSPAIPYYYTADDGVVIYDEGDCKIRLLVANYRNSLNAYVLSKPNDGERKYEILDNKGNYKSFNQKLYDADWEQAYDNLSDNNVTEARKGAFDANRASIILHISYGAEKYVICGDATGDTLNMVLNQYPNLKEVTILQSPHHGSDTNGSYSSQFAETMNPQIAVISTPYYQTGHYHPRKINASNYTVSGARNWDGNTDNNIKSRYGWWTDTEQLDSGTLTGKHKKPGGKLMYYYQYTDQPYRLFMTGWMDQGYYHYTAPFASAGNVPTFRAAKDALVDENAAPTIAAVK